MSVRVDDPNRFLGDLEGYLAWAETNFRAGNGWCARHWSPAPVEGRNGLIASVLLMQRAVEMAPRRIRRAKGPKARELNLWLASLDKPICCLIGDDAVAAIWIEAGIPKTDNAA